MDNNMAGNERDLAEYRIEQAKECLSVAEMMVGKSAKSSVNRSYYCIFHAMRAVLAFDHFDSNKHSGIISAFRQKYIKTEIFAASFSRIIGDAFEVRNDSDYEDFMDISETQAVQQIENAKLFLGAVEKYLSRM